MNLNNLVPIFIKNVYKRLLLKQKYPTLKIYPNVSVGFDNSFEEGVTLYHNVNITGCKVGRYTYIARDCKIANADIGRFCSIGPEVVCGLGMHPTNMVSTHPSFYSLRGQSQVIFAKENHFKELQRVSIGNDVWIGARVISLDGVRIGNGAIIGAGALVNKDIPDYAIAVGIPSKVIKYRFNEEQIKLLNKICWWDWDIEKLKKYSDMFLDVNEFLEYFSKLV